MGRSGGGHSGGFSGGSRSSGGFSGGSRSGQSRSSYSSGRSSGYRNTVHHTYHHHHYGHGSVTVWNGSSIVTTVVMLALILILAFTFAAGGSRSEIGASTVNREKLPASMSRETDYYTDEVGWFTNIRTLEKGLKEFYRETGVQPHVVVTDGSYGTSVPELNAYSKEIYDKITSDEAHFVLVFYDDRYGHYNCGYTIGVRAKTIMDNEAVDILADYLDRYYNSDVSDEELFSMAFEKTGERIMTVTKTTGQTVLPVLIIAVAVVAVAGLGYLWWKKAKEHKLRKAEAQAKFLNTPLETFDDLKEDEKLQDLEKKYQTEEGK